MAFWSRKKQQRNLLCSGATWKIQSKYEIFVLIFTRNFCYARRNENGKNEKGTKNLPITSINIINDTFSLETTRNFIFHSKIIESFSVEGGFVYAAAGKTFADRSVRTVSFEGCVHVPFHQIQSTNWNVLLFGVAICCRSE